MQAISYIQKHKYILILFCLFVLHLFFRLYQLEARATFGWDQVDNAWQALRILTEGKYPLLGMTAKGNSGIFIGPLYYYLVAAFYWFTRLDPIASPIMAAATSVLSFFVLYIVASKLFDRRVGLMAVGIYTFSHFVNVAERVQWPVNFLPGISLVILYFLYQVVQGRSVYCIYLTLAVGFAFHIHFTAIFFPIIILATLPIIPWKKISPIHIALAVFLFFVCFIPQIWYFLISGGSGTGAYGQYLETYFHGFHLRRMVQLIHDAFIEFEALLPSRIFRNTVFFFAPLFFLAYIRSSSFAKGWKLCYLIALWILVPWLVFTTYSGELSEYYFSIQLYLAILIYAYLSVWVWDRRILVFRILIAGFWGWFVIANTQLFFADHHSVYTKQIERAKQMVAQGVAMPFVQGDPHSYLYYIYAREEDGKTIRQ